mmetsp:Transcript_24716/g.28168  ORF Transcript_24716/g.28168 Transcript_24716/m.28168 type:complete len:85 (+) Transcript_24716:649-903(+)
MFPVLVLMLEKTPAVKVMLVLMRDVLELLLPFLHSLKLKLPMIAAMLLTHVPILVIMVMIIILMNHTISRLALILATVFTVAVV